MTGYPQLLTRRLGQAVIVVALTYMVTFIVLTVMPGDPVSSRLESPDNAYSPDEIARLTAYYGLDRPYLEQLWHSAIRLLHGDLGLSLDSGAPVGTMLAHALPSTLALAGTALFLAIVIAGVIAAGANFSRSVAVRTAFHSLPAVLASLPVFVVGFLLLDVFSFQLRWISMLRASGPEAMILPALTLAIPVSAPIAQVLSTSIAELDSGGFIAVARAKGLSGAQVFTRHILKSTALPTLTIAGLVLGELIGGSVITEAVFSRYGLGTVINRAVSQQDVPMVQGVVILCGLAYVLVNLIVDLLYPILDPRVRPDNFKREREEFAGAAQ